MAKTKIRVAIGTVYPYDESRIRGGVEAVALSLTKALARRSDIELHVVSCSRTVRQSCTEQRGPVTFHWLAAKQTLYLIRAATVDAWRVRKIYGEIAPDIIHAQGSSEYALASPGNVPVILTIHGLELYVPAMKQVAHLHGGIGLYRRWLGKWILQRSAQKACGVISIAGDYVPQLMGKLLDGKPVYKIDNPVAESFWLAVANDPDSNELVLSVGEINQRKNAIPLIQAFSQVVQQLPEAKLHLAGGIAEPAYYELVRHEIARYGLEQNVRLLGRLAQPQLLEAYIYSSLVTLASIQETSPMALLQAMAIGKPVVATRVGGVPCIVEDGVTGYLVDPGDIQGMANKLTELLQDKPKRKRMGQAAKKVARERFAPDIVAERTVQAYRDVLQRKIEA